MRYLHRLILCAIVICTIINTGCVNPVNTIQKSDVSTTELKVNYDYPVFVRYGTGDCFYKGVIPERNVLPFGSIRCLMNFAYFNKTLNDTHTDPLRVDLIRNGQVIKSYTSGSGSLGFENIDDFLARSLANPGIVHSVPITIKVATDGEWGGWIEDLYGGVYEEGTGPATHTLNQSVFPVKVCLRNRGNLTSTPLTVELYKDNTFLSRSSGRNANNETCVMYG